MASSPPPSSPLQSSSPLPSSPIRSSSPPASSRSRTSIRHAGGNLNRTSRHARSSSARHDTAFEYEARPGDTTRDIGFYASQDGRRGVTTVLNVGVKRRRLHPSDLVDTLGNWTPLADDGGAADGVEDNESAEAGEKRKRYESSDEPMKGFRPLVPRFLDELLRHEALGDPSEAGACACCQAVFSRVVNRYRCKDCGVFDQCLDCVLARHALNPLHRLKQWNGSFWVRRSLMDLGLVYQLGHGGHPCKRFSPERDMVVMDAGYIHNIRIRYCACRTANAPQNLEQLLRNEWYPATTTDPATCATFAALDLFRLLSVVGNVNVHDFVGMLERQTDACRVKAVPDRYKAFGRMARQYAFLLRLIRAGRVHDAAGVWATKGGECAVLCWTCPQDDKNLPEGWRDVAPQFRFLYMLLLAIDANFRLKSRLRANQRDDDPLGPGWGHLLEEPPYKEHLKNYVAEKDVSTCIAFAALLQKDTRMTTGLRCSGVGGVVCARHEVVRPQGIGDLQKGERYANMDYILLASVIGITAMYLAISYDIACQWRVNFEARMAALPAHMQLDLTKTTLMCGLPVWHAAAHERGCQVRNSLSYLIGVGRTDGEGIERTWSGLNPLAWATKEMGPGARADAMDDKIDHHNFEKNIGQGTTLPRKLIIAIDERDRQVAEFQEVDSTLRSSLREAWQRKIDDWAEDRSKPNPYEVEGGKDGGPTEASVRLALTKDEAEEAAAGGGKLHGSSVTSFLVAGLQLEETQRRIRREMKSKTLLAADQSTKLADMRRAFFTKLRGFRRLQEVYMPAAVREVERDEDARDSELLAPQAEDVKLYLPSGLRTAADRQAGCKEGLAGMEAKLREGQCADALRLLRSRLHAKRHLLTYRDTNVVGQRAATRAYTLIGRVGERVDAAAAKYRRGRSALIVLKGPEACEEWRELKDTDIQLDEERGSDTNARKKLGNVGSKSFRRQGPRISSKGKSLPWIWTAGGGPGENEQELHDAVRVEWSKAKARKERWEEEVMILREEMKRVLRFLRWRSLWWEKRRGARRGAVRDDVQTGLEAYAARQAALHREIARRFKTMWDTSSATAVRMALRDDAVLADGMAAFGEWTAADRDGEGNDDGDSGGDRDGEGPITV
ncbi:hypothetical protein B0H15DRAFT_951369 [Mycena belliarum]|uniref:CxC2-like cysteine cluster KDZ transposase-associated domain-containing protein n=1 Tax=Mycena belliarum TaxID=1033014 RepID=A0AAD6U547_9AGAR|nr:hypothetical protein B0H15DRAFT_951369 [Mycena belliae]